MTARQADAGQTSASPRSNDSERRTGERGGMSSVAEEQTGNEYIAVIIAIDFYRQTITLDSWRLPSCSDDASSSFSFFPRSLFWPAASHPFPFSASCASSVVIVATRLTRRTIRLVQPRQMPFDGLSPSSTLGGNRVILFSSIYFFSRRCFAPSLAPRQETRFFPPFREKQRETEQPAAACRL